jgi:hypothetical protein
MDSDINNNRADKRGGAFYLENSNFKLEKTNFSNNSALIGGISYYSGWIPYFITA